MSDGRVVSNEIGCSNATQASGGRGGKEGRKMHRGERGREIERTFPTAPSPVTTHCSWWIAWSACCNCLPFVLVLVASRLDWRTGRGRAAWLGNEP